MVRWLSILALCSSCAIGRVSADGAVTGFAFGHARIQGGCPPKIQGGSIATTWLDLLGAAAAGAVAYFSAGAAGAP